MPNKLKLHVTERFLLNGRDREVQILELELDFLTPIVLDIPNQRRSHLSHVRVEEMRNPSVSQEFSEKQVLRRTLELLEGFYNDESDEPCPYGMWVISKTPVGVFHGMIFTSIKLGLDNMSLITPVRSILQ